MSLRLFVYYCALVGAWSGFVGWALARAFAGASEEIWQASLYGLFLGLAVALGLSLVDGVWNFQRAGPIVARVGVALLIGLLGGFVAGLIGGTLFWLAPSWDVVFLFSWVLLGVLGGVAVSAFDLVAAALTKNLGAGLGKFVKCVVGGAAGGFLGGVLALVLRLLGRLLGDATGNDLWGPTAIGFVALGLFIGLLVGLSQVLLKEAWLKVEAGFRPGREMILAKDRVVIGRAETCDVPLFGDTRVEKQHATIVLEKGSYYLDAAATPIGTFVNDRQIVGRAPLKSGDLIRVGKNELRFNERRKKK
jgi:hypothetical protein